ncbi:MAG TPA: hypothetical protein VES58_06040, partial [Syntrophobacteria bacterium]|nr:hypothetical protein [Syntrophobacteria bacterium]
MITIGFSSHHVEALPFAREQMERHQTIILEEPPSPGFAQMLEGTMPLDDYLLELDSGFPEFDRRMHQLLIEFHRQGKRILQMEPYLERLLQIHELFADGTTPDAVLGMTELRDVYLAENHATGALLGFYALSMKAPFEEMVEGVKRFARADAMRLVLRERLRARAIVELVRPGDSTYVEAGYIHYPLYRFLRQELGRREKIGVVFLLEPVVRKLGGKRRNLGPGDILTLHYAFHNTIPAERANLLAARSLIYIKLINKEELLPRESEVPHSEDEVMVNRLVESLDLPQCRDLFDRIRRAD